jgi:hypothetical protein
VQPAISLSILIDRFIIMERRVSVEYIEDVVLNLKKKWTHTKISDELKRKYPDVKGLSEMSVRRFCSEHNIHRELLDLLMESWTLLLLLLFVVV